MRAAEVAFVGALVHRHRALLPLLQTHLDDFDGVLPHVFLADVTRWLVAAAQHAESRVAALDVISFIEASYRVASAHERELIAVSFVENLPHEGQPGAQVRELLGPGLRHQRP